MNLLYAYPVFLPVSGGDGEISIEFVYALSIVLNVVWLCSLVVAKIHTCIINSRTESWCCKETIRDRDYFFFTSLCAFVVDALSAFFGLVFWVETLL